MAEKANRDPELAALELTFGALKPLDDAARRRVISSVFALLGMSDVAGTPPLGSTTAARSEEASAAAATSSTRPVSIVELLQQKNPGTNAQRIGLFAYYRERYEGLSRFAREDLKPYFAKARLAPAANFDRDFVETLKKGWIHEEGADSYLTSKGLEAVESGFSGERKYSNVARAAGAKRLSHRKRPNRKSAKK